MEPPQCSTMSLIVSYRALIVTIEPVGHSLRMPDEAIVNRRNFAQLIACLEIISNFLISRN